MALEDKDIFMGICEIFSGQPIEVIMEQYEKAKRLNLGIEQRFVTASAPSVEPLETGDVEVVEETEPEPVVPPKKRYTKRMLKVKPQDAITDDEIYCCICGEKRQSLTGKHLASHEITVADYKKLCGYPTDLPLMSHKGLIKSRENIRRAQQARIVKRKANGND